MNLNTKINTKIQQLQYPGHFQLGHEHLSVWAAAWNKDEAQADLETLPSHMKFNALPGHKGALSLLQCWLAECAQPEN
ncbi:hypothetical protein BDR05DRAFT_1006929 [Suillus weaverae]|nr:hypothetical protein BDR05DRAFT_1006929 [Suillus weaverae]